MSVFDRLFGRARRVTEDNATVELTAPKGPALRVGNVQGVGARERQEDSFALLNASDPEVLAQRGLFAVVCDGMGGMEGGREISEGAVDGFLQLFQALNDEGDVPRQLREGTCALSDGLFQRFNGRSGTTAVAVRVFQNALHWISVGDSAIFLRRGGGVFQLNQEHTQLQAWMPEILNGTRSYAESVRDPNSGKLTSFIGMGKLRAADLSLRSIAIAPGDRILLMTDGVFNALPEGVMAELLSKNPDVQQAADALEQAVLQANMPGQDNFTAMILGF